MTQKSNDCTECVTDSHCPDGVCENNVCVGKKKHYLKNVLIQQ